MAKPLPPKHEPVKRETKTDDDGPEIEIQAGSVDVKALFDEIERLETKNAELEKSNKSALDSAFAFEESARLSLDRITQLETELAAAQTEHTSMRKVIDSYSDTTIPGKRRQVSSSDEATQPTRDRRCSAARRHVSGCDCVGEARQPIV